MNRLSRRFLPALLMCVFACVNAVAQEAVQTSPGSPHKFSRVVQGNPYSGVQTTVSTQTLANGTTITHQNLVKVYRDSEGRERREFFQPATASGGQADTPRRVMISDPVAKTSFTLDTQSHTAHSMGFAGHGMFRPSGAGMGRMNSGRAGAGNLQPVRQELGTQTIEGVEATGTRTTLTIPAGARGNSQPIQIVSETWRSAEMHITLMSTHSDPRTGTTVVHLSNVSREEPAAELFQVPADYTVQQGRANFNRANRAPVAQ